MATDLSETFELTRETLQSLITKPKLSDKLLNKPPFRFLHDIVTNVIHATDFAPGLYTPEELDSANVKEKTAKINFLTKIIMCVGHVQHQALDIRASKVVAGLEPECTNAFLQALGSCAADSSRSGQWPTAVEQTLNGDEPSTTTTEAEMKPEPVEAKSTTSPPDAKQDEKEQSNNDDNEGEAEVVIPVFNRPPTRQSGGGRHSSPEADADVVMRTEQPRTAESKAEKKEPVAMEKSTASPEMGECGMHL